MTEQANERHEGLLELARPELYRRNLFRVLSLPVTATLADVRRRQKRLEMERKLGVAQVAAARSPLALEPAPTEEEARAALERLSDPEARLLDELFWFWPVDGAADPALQAIEQGRLDEARKAWAHEGDAGGHGAVARHNLAVLDHLLALDHELAPGGADGGAKLWTSALAGWNAVAGADGFWERFRERIRELDDARLTGGTLRRLRATLPRAILGINAALAFQAGARKDAATARRHVDLLRAAGRDGLADEALRAALEPHRRQIKAVIEDARSRWKEAPQTGDRIVRELHERATALLATVNAVLPEADVARIGLHDLAAEAILEGARDFARKTDGWAEGARLVELARALAASPTERAKQETEVGLFRNNAEAGNDWCAPGYWELPTAVRDQLEAIRPRTESGDWDGALAALGALDPALGKPLHRAAAHCLSIKAIRSLNAALAEYRLEPPIRLRLLESLRAMGESGLVHLVAMRPTPSTPSYLKPPCPSCHSTYYTSWYNFEWKGIPIFWCESCHDRCDREIEQQKAVLRPQLTRTLEHLLLAEEIDPGDAGVQQNLAEARRLAGDLGAAVPGDGALLALCRSTLPRLAGPIEARIERARQVELEAARAREAAKAAEEAKAREEAQAREAAAKARAAEAARRARVRRRTLLPIFAALLAVVAWRGWEQYKVQTPFATVHTSEQALAGLWGSAADDVWAMGNGLILHWDGRSWARADFGQALVPALRAVWGSARDDAWTVGENGVAFHWDGSRWAAAEGGIGTSETLGGVGGSAPDDVWAVGAHGVILHWDGKCWSEALSPTYRDLHGVWASSASDAWAVGEAGILRWDGEAWTIAADGGGQLRAVWGSAPDDVWFVGDAGHFLHWDGRTLTHDQHSPVQARGISGTGRGDVWVVGTGGEIFHWDGARWSALPGAGRRPGLVAAWSAGGDGVWALGSRLILRTRPGAHAGGGEPPAPAVQSLEVAERRTEAGSPETAWAWSTVREGTGTLTGLWGSGPADIWAAGSEGALRWNGKRWSPVRVGKGAGLAAIYGAGPGEVWALGPPDSGQIWRWSGAAWKPVPSHGAGYRGLWVGGPRNVWAVGEQGRIDRWNGRVWEIDRPFPPSTITVQAIWGSPSAGLWGVGDSGFTLSAAPGPVNGVNTSFSGFSANLLAVQGSAPDDVWAVGQWGTILHWDGKSWTPSASGVDLLLRAIWSQGRDDVFVVGDLGVTLHWDGKSWRRVRSGTKRSLNAVWGDGKGTVWAAGDNGTILRLQKPAAPAGEGKKP